MKKYVVFVQDGIQSESVQRELFKYGFSWFGGGKKVNYTDKRFIFMNSVNRGSLSHAIEWSTVVNEIINGAVPISVRTILNEADTLDGTQKMITLSNGKEVSEETILSLLRQAGEDA